MTLELPSSKAVVSFVTLLAVAGTAFLDAAEVVDLEVWPWLYPVVGALGMVAVYVKRENRPSSSARETFAK